MRNKRYNNAFTSVILSTKFMSCFPASLHNPTGVQPLVLYCTHHWRTSIRPLNFVPPSSDSWRHHCDWDICATFQASSGDSERGFSLSGHLLIAPYFFYFCLSNKTKSRNRLRTITWTYADANNISSIIQGANWSRQLTIAYLFPQVIAEGQTWMVKRWTFSVKVQTIILFVSIIWQQF